MQVPASLSGTYPINRQKVFQILAGTAPLAAHHQQFVTITLFGKGIRQDLVSVTINQRGFDSASTF